MRVPFEGFLGVIQTSDAYSTLVRSPGNLAVPLAIATRFTAAEATNLVRQRRVADLGHETHSWQPPSQTPLVLSSYTTRSTLRRRILMPSKDKCSAITCNKNAICSFDRSPRYCRVA